LANATTTSITLFIISGCEYRMDGGAWQVSPTFNELIPNMLYQFEARKVETETHFVSPAGPAASFSTLPLGIEDNELANVLVYSNRNVVYIKTVQHVVSPLTVEIMDMLGRIIHKSSITDVETAITLQVANGIYNVRIITQDGKTFSRKVVIER
jgi:hypothetical protein